MQMLLSHIHLFDICFAAVQIPVWFCCKICQNFFLANFTSNLVLLQDICCLMCSSHCLKLKSIWISSVRRKNLTQPSLI